MKSQTALVCLLVVFVTGPSVHGQQSRDRFTQWDKNKDGKLVKDELPEPARNRFAQLDADHDGVVTRAEMAAYLQRRNSRRADANRRPNTAPNRNTGARPEAAAVNRNAQRRAVQANAPTYADVKYGSHARNVMDVWLAESDKPTPVLVSIHGGGFRSGNKSVAPELRDACLKSGISVVAITYRLSQDAIAPAQFLDGARAIQFIRYNAKKWNLDPTRIASTGGSAGAGISLWLGFHDDLADPDSDDPVLRQSSRLTCMAVSNGQTSYDPRFIRKMIPESDQVYRVDPLRQLFDADLDKLDQLPQDKYDLFEEVSPIHHLTKDDAPALLTYLVRDSEQPIGIHSPRFGDTLKKEMDKFGIRCEVVTHMDRDDPRYVPLIMDFVTKEFGMK